MAGGTFTAQNKVRPGVYVNTVGLPQEQETGTRGTVLLMDGIAHNWGKQGIIELTADADFKKIIGADLTDKSARSLKAAFDGGATKVLYINANDGAKASITDAKLPWTFTATYPGTLGNDITVDVIKDLNDNFVTVKYILDSEVVENEKVQEANELVSNDYVTVNTVDGADDKFNALAGEESYKLAGGTTEPQNNLSDLLSDALETATFDVATTAGFDINSNMHALLAQLIKDLRDKEGYHVTAVVPGLQNAKYDSDCVSVVTNGLIMDDDSELETTIASAYFAGASASVSLSQSLTNSEVVGAKDTMPRLTNSNIIDALEAGHVVFTNRRGGSVAIEQDINSLVTIGRNQNSSFRKNRTIRTLDYIANHIKDIAERVFIGKVSNDETGRGLLKAEIVGSMNDMVKAQEIEDFKPEDVTTVAGQDTDGVVVNISVKPVDSIEKIYMTIKSR